jgi:hypothetical protein
VTVSGAAQRERGRIPLAGAAQPQPHAGLVDQAVLPRRRGDRREAVRGLVDILAELAAG